ncbi:MAG: c-type cytochrome biogenesis protein CcmI [Gammaproteobacteria bacterium]|nr:c-type cytochrome biogenesis protein CcmI [Gammaproteobacteria bacterium]
MEVYLAVAAVGVLAVLGVVGLAVRSPRVAEPDTADALFADRRLELAGEADAQDLDEKEVASLEEELALTHLDESAQAVPSGEAAPGGVPLLPLLVGSVAMLGVAIALYAVWGESRAPVLARTAEIMRNADPGEMKDLEAALADRLDRVPADVNTGFVLGHLRMQMADYEGASEAFAALHEVAGPIGEVDIAWAQARYRVDEGEMSPATRMIVDRVLARTPDHPGMLELLAVDALQRRDFGEAAGYLSRALRQSMPDSRRAALAEILALARSHLPKDAMATDADDPAIGVSISLAAGFQASPDAPVFVIARDPDAPRPPLAVRRLTVADLPARIELTDADAMMPGRSLSGLDAVELVARVSLGGSPSARTGDLESEVEAASPGGEPVTLRIEHRVP